MRRFALIGEKLAHSASVPIHRAIWRGLGIEADYRLIEIPRDRFAAHVPRLMRELDGFNVTIPYKVDVIPLLDRLDPAAQAIGAVNTVICGERPIGFNTDAAGLEAMLRHAGMDPAGQPVWILGSGGASKAARYAAGSMGASSVHIVSRTPENGERSYDELAHEGSGLLINCTPAGMHPRPDLCPLTTEQMKRLFPRLTGVADLIYNPQETVLTHRARAAGIPACTGLYMLAAQAAEAERLWFPDIDFPAGMTARILKELTLF